MKEDPIFVNSLFRSGSTYIYNVFQRATDPRYYCFQEPLHELNWQNRNTPEKLDIPGISEMQKSLRHPEMTRGYFDSMIETHSAWHHLVNETFGYDRVFKRGDVSGEVAFLEALIVASASRPVIQECRLSWRAGAIKNQIEGTFIHLWRNPRDQWWSYKATPYFGSINRLIASAEGRPSLVQWALDEGDVPTIPSGDLQERLSLAMVTPPAPEASYRLHFALWLESQIELSSASDIDISIDRLSSSKAYRDELNSVLIDNGITGLDFSDCGISSSDFSTDETDFFERIEKDVEEQFYEVHAALDRDFLDAIIARKQTSEAKSQRKSTRLNRLSGDAARARQVALSAENHSVLQREAALKAGGGLLAMHAALGRLRTQLEQDYEGRLHEQAVEIGRLNHACVDRQAALDAANQHYESALAHMRVQATRSQNHISRIITEMREARENWAERADRYEKALSHFREQVGRYDAEILSLRHEINDGRAQRMVKNDNILALRQRIHALEQSTSWKITAPVRWVSKALSFRVWLAVFKEVVRRLLEVCLAIVRVVPGASWAVRKTIFLVPPLRRKLEHFVAVRRIEEAAASSIMNRVSEDEPASTPRPDIDARVTAKLSHYVETSYGSAALEWKKGGPNESMG